MTSTSASRLFRLETGFSGGICGLPKETTFLSCEILKGFCILSTAGSSVLVTVLKSLRQNCWWMSLLWIFLKAYGGITIQENMVRREECTDENVTKFSKSCAWKEEWCCSTAGLALSAWDMALQKRSWIRLLSEAQWYPGSEEGHQHPRLHWQDHSW